MAYEVFEQQSNPVGIFGIDHRNRRQAGSLNSNAGDLMKGLGAKFVHLLWDAEARKIALRPLAKGDSRSYKLSVPHAHKRGMLVSASTFLRYIGWPLGDRVTLPAEWKEKEKILEAVLPVAKGSTRGAPETSNETLRTSKERKK